MNREPALIVGAVGAVVNAALVVAFAFVAGVTPEQREAVFGLAAALVALVGVVTGAVTRARVTPVGRGPGAEGSGVAGDVAPRLSPHGRRTR